MEIKCYEAGPLGTNMYIVTHNSKCFIIDPAGYPAEMDDVIGSLSSPPDGIFFTHGHIDHVLGAKRLTDKFSNLVAWIHEKDIPLYEMAEKQAASFGLPFFGLPPVKTFNEFEGFFKVLHTPGHSKGSVCLYCEEENVIFTGDTLFHASVGRTDFWGGSWPELENSIKNTLFKLPPKTTCYPGHNEETTIGWEVRNNPFF